MSEIYQPSLDFSTPQVENPHVETPKERGERLANEMLALAMRVIAENPDQTELPSDDNRSMYDRSLPVSGDSVSAQDLITGPESGDVYTPQQVFDLAKSLRKENNAKREEKGLPPITSETIAKNTQLGATNFLNKTLKK